MENKNSALGMAAAFAANLIFGFSFIFSKLALKAADPLIILSVRFTFSFLFLNILLALRLIKVDFSGKPIKKLILMSFAQPLLYFVFELYGMKFVSSALSGVIISLVPVGVVCFSAFFLNEKPTIRQYICAAVSLVGVCLVSLLNNNGNKNSVLGVVLLFAAVVCAVAFNLLSRNQSKTFSAIERTYFMFFVAFIGFNLIALTVLNKNYKAEMVRAFSSADFIIGVLYLSIISSVAAFILYNYSTTKITAIRSSSFSNIITVVSVLAGTVFLSEMSPYELLLCVPIILGVYGVNR